MAESSGGGEKTEKATPKRRRDAREKEGNVLQSNEVTTAVSVFGIFLALRILAQFMLRMMENTVYDGVAKVADSSAPTIEFFGEAAFDAVVSTVLILAPILLVSMALSVLPVIMQTRGLFSMKNLRPKFGKLNPLKGIRNLFSMQSLVGIVKGIIELAAIGYVVYSQIMSRIPMFKKMPDMSVIQAVVYTADAVFSTVMIVAVVFIFVAAGDFLFQWWQYEKKLKMSKQEVKDEYKQVEGDPQIKSKIKQKQREIAQKRMMEEVPKADVVVRNPTHFAVALVYKQENAYSAPKVVAKGQDSLALRIVEIAEQNGVYITENRPLARTLYETVDIGREIPSALYTAVATVIAEMMTEKNKKLQR